MHPNSPAETTFWRHSEDRSPSPGPLPLLGLEMTSPQPHWHLGGCEVGTHTPEALGTSYAAAQSGPHSTASTSDSTAPTLIG